MDSPRGIASRLRRTITGPMWHGPGVVEAIADLTPAQAAAHHIDGAHSVWELVLHIAAWAEIAHARLEGTAWKDPSIDEDWPPIPRTHTAATWKSAIARATASYEALATATAALEPEALREMVVGQEYTRAVMLHGVVEHGVYHAGQIVLLRRAMDD